MDTITYAYVSGMVSMGHFIAGLFFLRFWRRTGDGLFLSFAGAFWLLAIGQGIAALGGIVREEYSWIYLLRLVAFGLIIYSIIRKNLKGTRRWSGPRFQKSK